MRHNKLKQKCRVSNETFFCGPNIMTILILLKDNGVRFCFQATVTSAPRWCPRSKLAINWNATLIWRRSSLMQHWTGKGKPKYIWQNTTFQSASDLGVPDKVTCPLLIPLTGCISQWILFPQWNNILYYAWKWMGGGRAVGGACFCDCVLFIAIPTYLRRVHLRVHWFFPDHSQL